MERLTRRDTFNRAYLPDVPQKYLNKISKNDKESYNKIMDAIDRLAAWEDNGIFAPVPIGTTVFRPYYSTSKKAFVAQTLFVHAYTIGNALPKLRMICTNIAGDIISAYDEPEWGGNLIKNIHFDKNECLEHCKILNKTINESTSRD